MPGPLHCQSKIISTNDAELIRNAAPEDIVVLYRGCNKVDAERMRDAMTAGGSAVDENCGQPSKADVAAPGAGQRQKLPEFTHRPDSILTHRFKAAPGVVMGVVQVWIQRRYLARGDACVEGWCARHEAPIERWAFKTMVTATGRP